MTTEAIAADAAPEAAPRMRTRRQMLAIYAVRRVLFVPFGAAFLVTASFYLINVIPANPGAQILGSLANQEQITVINEKLGFDQSITHRFVTYVSHLLHGDLGTSYFTGTKVSSEIAQHLPNTLELVIPSLIISFILGVALAFLAVRGLRGLRPIANGAITLLQAVPDFLLAVVLIYVLFVRTGVLPAPLGQTNLGETLPPHTTGMLLVDAVIHGDWGSLGSIIEHMAIPVLTLSLALTPLFGRIARAGMLRAWEAPYVEFGRANGLGKIRIFTFVMQDIRGSLLTYVVTALAALIGGAAIVETIFAWNGIGQWIVVSMSQIDLPAIEGFVVVTTLAALLLYVVLDILVAALDPRIEVGRRAGR